MKLCTVPGCNREHHALGLCTGHKTRLERYGDVHADIPLRPRRKCRGICSVPWCTRETMTRDLCTMHYSRRRRRQIAAGTWQRQPSPAAIGAHR